MLRAKLLAFSESQIAHQENQNGEEDRDQKGYLQVIAIRLRDPACGGRSNQTADVSRKGEQSEHSHAAKGNLRRGKAIGSGPQDSDRQSAQRAPS